MFLTFPSRVSDESLDDSSSSPELVTLIFVDLRVVETL
jgi:hypothetical protein